MHDDAHLSRQVVTRKPDASPLIVPRLVDAKCHVNATDVHGNEVDTVRFWAVDAEAVDFAAIRTPHLHGIALVPKTTA